MGGAQQADGHEKRCAGSDATDTDAWLPRTVRGDEDQVGQAIRGTAQMVECAEHHGVHGNRVQRLGRSKGRDREVHEE